MKKIIIILAILFSRFSFNTATAQLHVNANIGAQPIWGPVGYDYAEYYYMPDIDTYYYVPGRKYVYLENGRWLSAPAVPSRYKSYDFYNGYKVVINEPTPYRNAVMYRTKYASYKGRHGQENIRNSNDSKYFVIRNHPQHIKFKKVNEGNNGNKGGKGNKGNQGNKGGKGNNGNNKHKG